MDNTHGAKSNRVQLNVPHVLGGMEPPEPGIAVLFIDGIPIHMPHSIQIMAAIGMTTKVSIVFEAEVAGTIGGKDINDIIRESQG